MWREFPKSEFPNSRNENESIQGLGISGIREFGFREFPPSLGFTTRDRVALWQHGTRRFLRFIGRDSQVLKINGELVYLQPLQARLEATCFALGMPLEAVIAPLAHARQGTVLVLVHGADALPDAALLLATYNAGAAPLERVLEAIALPSMPRSTLGKVNLPEVLRILVAQGRAGF